MTAISMTRPDAEAIENQYSHSIIDTGGNISNDYVADFDGSGRVIVAGIDALYLYANDRDYQMQLDPLAECYVSDEIVPNTLDTGDESGDSHIAHIGDHADRIFIRHTSGVIMNIRKLPE